MLRRFSCSTVAVVIAAAVGFVSLDAQATCLTQCDATLTYFDCSQPPPNQWDVKMTLSFDLECETCCSPPGGPLTCNAEDPDLSLLSLTHLAQPYDGTFFLSKSSCKTGPLIMFNPGLQTGPYELLYENMILAQFMASDAGGCKTNDQCPKCSVCVNGECKGLGLIMCTQDSDCGKGEVCKIDPEAACANQCVPKGEDQCKSDADCPPCWVCADGECKATGFAICTQDTDCGDGKVCLVDAVAPCNNQCVAIPPECTSNEDCGVCAVCVAGECKGLGLVMCTTDAECGPGEMCQVDPVDSCKNACVPKANECVTDADCPVCSVCVAGECKGLGLIVCMVDSDCPPDFVCEISPTANCYNACVPNSIDEDAGTTDDAGSTEDAGTTDDTATNEDTTSPTEDTASNTDTSGGNTDTGGSQPTDATSGSSGDSSTTADTAGNGNNGKDEPKDDGGCQISTVGVPGPSYLWMLLFGVIVGLGVVRKGVMRS